MNSETNNDAHIPNRPDKTEPGHTQGRDVRGSVLQRSNETWKLRLAMTNILAKDTIPLPGLESYETSIVYCTPRYAKSDRAL